MPIVSISLSGDLLEKLDSLVRSRGYSSRSEAVRDAVRDSLSAFELSIFEKGRVIATVTAVSQHEDHDVDEKLSRLRHDRDDIVSGNMHIHLGRRHCLEVYIVEGDSSSVLDFISRVRALRGIQEVKYTVVPMVEHPYPQS